MRHLSLLLLACSLPAMAQDVEWVFTGGLDYVRPIPTYDLIEPQPNVFVDEAGRALLSRSSSSDGSVALRLDGQAWEPFSEHQGVVAVLGDTLVVTLVNRFDSGHGHFPMHLYYGYAVLWDATQTQEPFATFSYEYGDGFFEAFAFSPGGALWFGIQNYHGGGNDRPPEGNPTGVKIGTTSLEELEGASPSWTLAALPGASRLHALTWTNHGPLVATDDGLYAQAGGAWVHLAFAGMNVRTIAETASGTLLAGVGDGLYRSTDAGATWAEQDPLPGPTHDLLDAGEAVLAAVEGSGVFRSLDDGVTWTPTALASSSGALAGLPTGPYYATAPGATLYRSEDGIAWEPASYFDPKDSQVYGFYSTPEGIITGTNGRLYRYANDTMTWQRLAIPDLDGDVTGLFVDPEGLYYITMGTVDTSGLPPFFAFVHIYRSSDEGSSWHHVRTLLGGGGDLEITEAGTLLLTLSTSGEASVLRSTDDGATWTPVLSDPSYIRPIEQAESGTVRVLSRLDRYWSSTDDGLTWTQHNFPPRRLISIVEQADGSLVAAADDGVWLAAGDGEPWEPSLHQYDTDGITVNPAGDLFIRASQCADGPNALLCRSTDGGVSWPAFEAPPVSTINAFASDQDGILFVGGDAGVFRTLQTTVDSEDGATPSTAMAVYPNPVARTATLRFATASAGRVTVTVFDVLGRTVTTLHDADVTPGSYDLQWDTADHAGGMYFVRFVTPSGASTLPVTVVR